MSVITIYVRYILLLLLILSPSTISVPVANDDSYDDTTNTTTSTSEQRHLALGDFTNFNKILEGAILRFPDSTLNSDGVTLRLTNIRCWNLAIGDVNLWSRQISIQTVDVDLQVTNLDMVCRASYSFSWLFFSGSGYVDMTSVGNDATLKGQVQSANMMQVPPENIVVQRCDPSVTISNIDFSGGVLDWILNIAESLVGNFIANSAESRICSELRMMMEDTEGLLQLVKRTIDRYYTQNKNFTWDPVAPENNLWLLQLPPNLNLLNFQDPNTQVGGWLESTVNQAVDYMSAPAEDPSTGAVDMRVNILLRQHILDEDRFLTIDSTSSNDFWNDTIVYEGHNSILKTSVHFDSIQLFGLDSLTQFNPLDNIGKYVFQNQLAWDYLGFRVQATIKVSPSTLKDSIIETPRNTAIVEHVEVFFGIDNLIAELSIMSLFNKDSLNAITLGSLLEKDNILSCLLSTVVFLDVTSLSVDVKDILTPTLNGFVSPGLDGLISNATDAGFLMYETLLLNAAPKYFQLEIGPLFAEMFLQKYTSQNTSCPLFDWAGSDVDLIDFRDLLLPSVNASIAGATGQEPYGNLFSSYAMPYLRENVFTGKRFNDILRGITERYSNVTGSMFFPGNNFESSGHIKIAGLDARFGFQVSDITIENIDSVSDPFDIFRPIIGEPNTLYNIASIGVDSKPLGVTCNLYLSLVDDDNMQIRNKMRISFSFENVVMMASVLLKIPEKTFTTFPLRDFTNINCWLATILSKSNERRSRLRGFDLIDHSFSIGDFSLNVNCTNCSSPKFDLLLLSLYDLSNTSETITLIQDKTNSVLESDFFQVLLDHAVENAVTKCPHRPEFDTNATGEESLLSSEESLGLFEVVEVIDKSMYLTLANLLIACFLFIFGIICRCMVNRRNKQWMESLSGEGHFYLKLQRDKEIDMEAMLNETTASLLKSECIPKRVQYGVPFFLALDLGLYMSAHLSVISVVDIDATLAGEAFTINSFLEFKFIESIKRTLENGGTEMAIFLLVFTGVWPYIKIFLSLAMWITPPNYLGVTRRGRILLWIDALAKFSIIDVFTLIIGVALLLVFIGGPDESYISEGALYSLKAIIVPRAGFYCVIVAQRISRVSSRLFLEYHEQVINNAVHVYKTKTYKRDDDISAVSPPDRKQPLPVPIYPWSNVNEKPELPDRNYQDETTSTDSNPEDDSEVSSIPSNHEVQQDANNTSPKETRWGTIGVYFSGIYPWSNVNEEPELPDRNYQDETTSMDSNLEDDSEVSSIPSNHEVQQDANNTSPKETRWGTIGVYFSGITILIVFIIGVTFAPSISLDASSLAALAIESDKTFEEIVQSYGVFLFASGVLVKTRFVFNDTADYIFFGILLLAGVVSIGIVFFIQVFQFIKQKLKQRHQPPEIPSYGHKGCGIPFYIRRIKWRHMEVYMISVAVGVWQLGSVASYAIYLYCDILNRIFAFMAFAGLAEATSAECYNIQASLPENFVIILGSFTVLMIVFILQALAQKKKNIIEGFRWIDDSDVPHLSMAWSKDSPAI